MHSCGKSLGEGFLCAKGSVGTDECNEMAAIQKSAALRRKTTLTLKLKWAQWCCLAGCSAY